MTALNIGYMQFLHPCYQVCNVCIKFFRFENIPFTKNKTKYFRLCLSYDVRRDLRELKVTREIKMKNRVLKANLCQRHTDGRINIVTL